MTDVCDIDLINASLNDLKYELNVKTVGNGTKFIWLYAKDNSYALKVPTVFMLKFERILKSSDDLVEELKGLFG
jgi:hypothetical protein